MINDEGEIVTNAHVVTTGKVPELREARTVYVEFADGNQVEAEVRGETGYLYRVRKGKVSQVGFYAGREEALEAAVLPEWVGAQTD